MWPGLGVWQVHTCVIRKMALDPAQVSCFEWAELELFPYLESNVTGSLGPNNPRQKWGRLTAKSIYST